ncbi:MAG: Minf_1886 family protein [Planctomycetota bacterium]
MVEMKATSLDDLVRHVGRYPEEAFLFIREGLTFATERMHGAETPVHRALQEYMASNQLDWNDLISKYSDGSLPPPLQETIDVAGGWEKLNRHVSGRDLCWGLRDLALQRWGLLARVVLDAWNIRSTKDFGRIVFGFIDFDLMQKQTDDTLDDFADVFSFIEALDEGFRRAGCGGAGREESSN